MKGKYFCFIKKLRKFTGVKFGCEFEPTRAFIGEIFALKRSEILAIARMKSADADEIHYVDDIKSVLVSCRKADFITK